MANAERIGVGRNNVGTMSSIILKTETILRWTLKGHLMVIACLNQPIK